MKQQYSEIGDEGLLQDDDEGVLSAQAVAVPPPPPAAAPKNKGLVAKIGKRSKLGKSTKKTESGNNGGKEKKNTSKEWTATVTDKEATCTSVTAGQKNWVHPPEALLRGHIVYNVKFLGNLEVDSPKGTDVVRDAIRKMKFNKQIKKAEGQKPPKVELTISIDGVTVQEPKYKVIQHRYPLHRISYCADDKSDKRMFTFIAKEADTSRHHCFVFDSDKCAEEITLTIGQAFDLAYRRFLETSNKDLDTKKQFLMLQKKVQQLTEDNLQLKARVADLERLIDPRVLEEFDKRQQNNGPGNQQTPTKPVVGTRLENLDLRDTNSTQPSAPHSNGVASQKGGLLPPPPIPARGHQAVTSSAPTVPASSQNVDLFGAPPFNPAVTPQPLSSPPQSKVTQPARSPPESGDPFGMGEFKPANALELEQQIQSVDRELMDLQVWEDSWPWNYVDINANASS